MKSELLIHPETLAIKGPSVIEGPVWRNNRLYFVDIPSATIFEATEDGEITNRLCTFGETGMLGTIAPCAASENLWIGACQRGIAFIDLNAGKVIELHPMTLGENFRFNDGKAGPDGAFYAGTCEMSFSRPVGALIRFAGPNDCRVVIDGIHLSNGLDWSQDGSRFYYTDSTDPQGSVLRIYDAENDYGNPREFIRLPKGEPANEQILDGLCLDRDERIYTAIWGQSCVRIYERGSLVDTISTPVPHPTCCSFGGKNGEYLFITSERTPQDSELAGGVFRAEAGARALRSERLYTGAIR